MKTLCISVKYINNFNRQQLADFQYEYDMSSDLYRGINETIKTILGSNNNNGVLYSSVDNITITSQNIQSFIINDHLSVIYSEVISPFGAYEFDRVDGIIYYFNSTETPHKNYPHIHASYSGETISIYLNTMKVIGEFKNRTKQKAAIKYVSDNIVELQKTWREIIK